MGRTRMDTAKFGGLAFFEGTRRRDLASMAPHTDVIQLAAGSVVVEAGEAARQLVVVASGLVGLDGPFGPVALGPGQAIAPHAVTRWLPFPRTVTTLSDVTLVVVNGPSFRWAAHEVPVLARRVQAAADADVDLTLLAMRSGGHEGPARLPAASLR